MTAHQGPAADEQFQALCGPDCVRHSLLGCFPPAGVFSHNQKVFNETAVPSGHGFHLQVRAIGICEAIRLADIRDWSELNKEMNSGGFVIDVHHLRLEQ
ncbi:hypothetical protein CEXT_699591 [Caerostris extrusa]|uniref:Uncharacterized protein n=1 Tax=Caerostris extrusa TaxID=172846 RepID=A0AAV4T7U2_CAEEX|nr:hypothetical protein CEXT_699591 [Caerostris extrusa]